MRIVLIGFMGSGKSSIGRLLHEKLNLPFIDTDKLIEEKAGMKISEIFAKDGEEKFRDYETEVLKEVSKNEKSILATGGGIIEKERNHQLLKLHSIVFYLKTNPENILKFTKLDQNRPLLKIENPLEFVKEKLKKRIPLYLKLSDYQIEASTQSLEASTQEIINYLKLSNPFNGCE